MQWIAPSEKDVANDTLEKRLWAAADQLRANSGLTTQQYSLPVLGLIFLRFAEVRFDKRRAELEKISASGRRASRVDDPTAYHAEGVIYLSAKARFVTLLNLPERADGGKAVNEAMADITIGAGCGSSTASSARAVSTTVSSPRTTRAASRPVRSGSSRSSALMTRKRTMNVRA